MAKSKKSGLSLKSPLEALSVREDKPGCYSLQGELTFATAGSALKKMAPVFSESRELVLELSRITRTDSAGLAILLDWRRRAWLQGINLNYLHLPKQLLAIARVARVDGILLSPEISP